MIWRGFPVFGLVLLAMAALMSIPAIYAVALGDWHIAAGFGYSMAVTAIAGCLLVVAMRRRAENAGAFGEFALLLATLAIAPLAAAAPIAAVMPLLGYEVAYFEMVSMITTTGATVFDRLDEVHRAVILWRAVVAWFGGLVALVMAYAVLAPRNLGGFEVRGDSGRTGAVGRLSGDPVWAGGKPSEAAGGRLARAISAVTPVYAGLTSALAVILLALGHSPLQAVVLSAGVLSTSGVSVEHGPASTASGFFGELVIAVFLVLAATRHSYGGPGRRPFRFDTLPHDPEMRLLFVIVVGLSAWLYLRHWIGVLELDEGGAAAGSLRALWGGFFTVLSFSTTTGYLSADWESARQWSGLDSPSLIFFGLAIMGGGIATTAGGVKLLRAYALFKHGARELERLVRPSSISGAGARKRGLRREGAQIAWIFVMMFLVTLAVAMLVLSLLGMTFENAMSAAVAALSNTGPLFPATTGGSWLTSVTPEGRIVLVVVMVLGRVEILALIAMLNADNWR
ncbi:TrkH family potassium uptake protein [Pikeienuella piscinae]|uniref:TrkH family potassium uptake protein n=1 Tax=Pikeienuella piscinae TaxID=2748098 RepID=A0A7L5BTP7_9RHOB|nr:TrkH family potassium uptake protein [Pikeienuella piscinae]QIE54461.1 TrkH family potassium uptake protein [Pikeienuella piscinae]